MLLRLAVLEKIASGEVDLAFRRWKRPTVKTGGRLRTRIGVLAIVRVEPVSLSSIPAGDARRAGFGSKRELLDELGRRAEGDVYRIELRFAGADEREELRERPVAGADERRELEQRLDRMDRAERWTRTYLELIAKRPATRAADLASRLGVETPKLKARVRRLKELGLTESLEVGYRLSPRGRSLLG